MRRRAACLFSAPTAPERTWAPAVEVTQRDGNYVVRAELAGINPDDVRVEITNEAIVIQGERREERDEDKGGLHVTERRYGRFYREIPLPEGAKAETARARFENGVLEISVPVEEPRSQRREIPLEGSGVGTSSSGNTGNAGNAGNAPGKAGASAGSASGSEKSGSSGGSEKAA